MKKYFLILVFIVAGFPVFAAIDHGSIAGKNLPLYHLRDGADPGHNMVEGVTFDFKAVTVGTKTWVWTNLNGKLLAGNGWSSQFRWWFPVKQEYNLSIVAGTQESHGIVGIPDINFCEPATPDANQGVITFLQEEEHREGHSFHVFYETDNLTYNYTQPNPTDANDQISPVLNTPTIVSQTEQQLRLLLSAIDDSENFFYYIEDAENNFVEISFSDETVLNLEPGVTYHFSVCAIDFSGNQSQRAAVTLSNLPDSIRNGSDFYLIYMDEESEAGLGTKVKEKTMFRGYDIWEAGETLEESDRTGVNAWGVSFPWVAFDITPDATTTGRNGGAIVAKQDEFDQAPKLKAVTDNRYNYYFHFAIKSPADQADAGWTLILYSDSTFGDEGLQYYVGPDTVAGARGLPWLGNYEHDGEWQHFEIPVSQLVSKGYKWGEPLSVIDGKVYLLGFQSPANKPGTELNLDAVFFYRKPVGFVVPPPAPVEPVFTEGTANVISFKIDSHSLNKLKIECTSTATINSAFVKLELDGVGLAGRWELAIAPSTIDGTTRYVITVPADEIYGWKEGAILGLNLGYKTVNGDDVNDNKVITEEGENAGKPILHKIGTGVDIQD